MVMLMIVIMMTVRFLEARPVFGCCRLVLLIVIK